MSCGLCLPIYLVLILIILENRLSPGVFFSLSPACYLLCPAFALTVQGPILLSFWVLPYILLTNFLIFMSDISHNCLTLLFSFWTPVVFIIVSCSLELQCLSWVSVLIIPLPPVVSFWIRSVSVLCDRTNLNFPKQKEFIDSGKLDLIKSKDSAELQ